VALTRKKSFVKMATGRMYRSCQPRRFPLVSPDDSIKPVSILVSTPMVMVAMMMRPSTIAPWMLSVKKEILNPPRAGNVFVSGRVEACE